MDEWSASLFNRTVSTEKQINKVNNTAEIIDQSFNR